MYGGGTTLTAPSTSGQNGRSTLPLRHLSICDLREFGGGQATEGNMSRKSGPKHSENGRRSSNFLSVAMHRSKGLLPVLLVLALSGCFQSDTPPH